MVRVLRGIGLRFHEGLGYGFTKVSVYGLGFHKGWVFHDGLRFHKNLEFHKDLGCHKYLVFHEV